MSSLCTLLFEWEEARRFEAFKTYFLWVRFESREAGLGSKKYLTFQRGRYGALSTLNEALSLRCNFE